MVFRTSFRRLAAYSAFALTPLAANAVPIRTDIVKVDGAALSQLGQSGISSQDAGNVSSLPQEIRVSGSIPSLGRFNAVLDTRKTFLGFGSSDTYFLQGEASQADNGSSPFFATAHTLRNGSSSLRLFVANRSTSKRTKKKRSLYEVRLQLDSNGKVIHASLHSSRSSLEKHLCSAKEGIQSSAQSLQSNDVSASAAQTVSVIVEADNEYASKVSSPATEAATIMNGVDTIYQRDLGIRVTTTIVSAPQTYSSALVENQTNYTFPLHDEMRAHRPVASRVENVHFLLTGKAPIGADIRYLAGAVPDLGTICRNNAYSVGFTIRFSTADDILTTAHEMGHLFGGEHDDKQTAGGEPGIMNSGTAEINGEITKFSAYSKQQIGAFLSQYGSCLSQDSTPDSQPTPETPTVDPKDGTDDGDNSDELELLLDLYEPKRDLRAATTALRVELYDEEDYVYEDEAVVLVCTNAAGQIIVTKTAVTDKNGIAKFKVSRPTSRNMECFAYYNDLSYSDSIKVAARKKNRR